MLVEILAIVIDFFSDRVVLFWGFLDHRFGVGFRLSDWSFLFFWFGYWSRSGCWFRGWLYFWFCDRFGFELWFDHWIWLYFWLRICGWPRLGGRFLDSSVFLSNRIRHGVQLGRSGIPSRLPCTVSFLLLIVACPHIGLGSPLLRPG